MATSADITQYALDALNEGRDPESERPGNRIYAAGDIIARTARDHLDADGKLFTELLVTVRKTGSIVYLPMPEGHVEAGNVAAESPAGATVAVPDNYEELTHTELKAICGALGLSRGGGTQQLIGRIEEYLIAQGDDADDGSEYGEAEAALDTEDDATADADDLEAEADDEAGDE